MTLELGMLMNTILIQVSKNLGKCRIQLRNSLNIVEEYGPWFCIPVEVVDKHKRLESRKVRQM